MPSAREGPPQPSRPPASGVGGVHSILSHARAAASRAEGASPRARVPPVDYGDKLPPMPGVGPWGRTVSGGQFDRLAGLFLLETVGAHGDARTGSISPTALRPSRRSGNRSRCGASRAIHRNYYGHIDGRFAAPPRAVPQTEPARGFVAAGNETLCKFNLMRPETCSPEGHRDEDYGKWGIGFGEE